MSGTFTLSVECRLATSHILPDCPPCDRLHGHTWTVRAYWTFDELNRNGMGTNFHVLEDLLRKEVVDRFDHRYLNDIPPFDKIPATSENVAREIYGSLSASFDPGPAGRLSRVEVWESPGTCAAYEAAASG